MPTLKKAEKQKPRTFNRADRQKVYQSAKWYRLRQAKLMANPLCEVCLKEDRVTPAMDVHHIDSFFNYTGNTRVYKAYDFSNLMSVCKECHGRIHSSPNAKE